MCPYVRLYIRTSFHIDDLSVLFKDTFHIFAYIRIIIRNEWLVNFNKQNPLTELTLKAQITTIVVCFVFCQLF